MLRIICSSFLILSLALSSQCQTTKARGQEKNVSLIQRLIEKTPSDWLFADEKDNICSISISYLGKATTKQHRTYLIATLTCDWGLSCRRTTRILVYGSDYNYLGNYYTEGTLPTSLDQNELIGQDSILTDLTNGIPDSLQIDTGMWAKFEK
jgi:hypothetical protein